MTAEASFYSVGNLGPSFPLTSDASFYAVGNTSAGHPTTTTIYPKSLGWGVVIPPQIPLGVVGAFSEAIFSDDADVTA